jgi:hypothetical protein
VRRVRAARRLLSERVGKLRLRRQATSLKTTVLRTTMRRRRRKVRRL